MKTHVGTMADEVLERIKNDAASKEFECKNLEEWYYTYAIWCHYVFIRSGWHEKQILQERGAMLEFAGHKNMELLRQKLIELFKKVYSNFKFSKELKMTDSILAALLNYEPDENEKNFDGTEAMIMG